MIGSSANFLVAMSLIRRFAACDAPILIEGDTGTGKELAAREIHYCSRRQGRPFVPVNCGALPDSLVEDELFGHVAGAFTDARAGREGLVEIAAAGTLFLDEIDTLGLKGQATLLRFMQDQEYHAVGSPKMRTADVRVLSASNANLKELVEKGQFRRDLYFRLNTLQVRLPPLRERMGDINILAAHFTETASARLKRPAPRLSPEALCSLNDYSWPGNVRELESILFRAVLLTEGAEIHASTLGLPPSPTTPSISHSHIPRSSADEFARFVNAKALAISAFEVDYLNAIIRYTNGNVTLAAKISGTERRQLGKLLKKHGIIPKMAPVSEVTGVRHSREPPGRASAESGARAGAAHDAGAGIVLPAGLSQG